MSELDLEDKVLSIVFCNDGYIRKQNRKYLKSNRPTDVLAFSMVEGERIGQDDILGDVIISVDTARRVAKSIKKSLDEELCLYLIHGILHLIGYRDDCKIMRKAMEQLQEKILNRVLEL